MANLLFYFLSVVAVLAGIGVIVSRSPVASILALLATFVCLAVIYLLAGFQTIAALQILVYAGAIMVLFLFVVMLLNLGHQDDAESRGPLFRGDRRTMLAFVIAFTLLAAIAAGVLSGDLPRHSPEPARMGIDAPKALASWMFGRYVLPFEAVSVLLLATAVGVLVLAKRERPNLLAEATDEDSRS